MMSPFLALNFNLQNFISTKSHDLRLKNHIFFCCKLMRIKRFNEKRITQNRSCLNCHMEAWRESQIRNYSHINNNPKTLLFFHLSFSTYLTIESERKRQMFSLLRKGNYNHRHNGRDRPHILHCHREYGSIQYFLSPLTILPVRSKFRCLPTLKWGRRGWIGSFLRRWRPKIYVGRYRSEFSFKMRVSGTFQRSL